MFDEWGAMLKHQDEIDKRIQQQQYEKSKQRQIDYKKQLDKQFRELQYRRKGILGGEMQKEEELRKYQEQILNKKAQNEQAKRDKLLMNNTSL